MDPSLAAAARSQLGLFTLAQARDAGYSLRQVQHRRETGCWEQMYDGVYRVAGAPASWEQQVLAACLAAGPGAVASHRAAARLWGLDGSGRPLVELSVAAGRYHRLDGVVVHRSTDLTADAATVRGGIPVTTPLRTLVDLGAVRGPRSVDLALDAAIGRRLVTIVGLRATLDAVGRRGRRGAGVLRDRLDVRSRLADRTESVLEAKLSRLWRELGLPEPECQYEVRAGDRLVGRVDFAYPSARIAIEADGYHPHSTLHAFRHDRCRQNDLAALGWTVLRFTSDEMEHHHDRIVRVVTSVLRARANTAG